MASIPDKSTPPQVFYLVSFLRPLLQRVLQREAVEDDVVLAKVYFDLKVIARKYH